MQQNEVGKIYTRPWGTYETLLLAKTYQVKRIVVSPGQRLSLQKHHHRAEHWVIVEGEGHVTLNQETIVRKEGQSIDIPKEALHRMANPTQKPVTFIEVQMGDYLGEDDIVRIEDDYHRK